MVGRRHGPRRSGRAGRLPRRRRPSPGYPAGAHYRNCWWVDDPGLPFFHASGINGQQVFVHVPSQTVVAKLSTWPTALSPWRDTTAAGVLAIAAELERTP